MVPDKTDGPSVGGTHPAKDYFDMGKLSKKLVVYLDQNFISEMAKARDNERVKPEFSQIYELLHQGFLDEKVIVPKSHFHDIETSLIPRLEERIKDYQGYLGQIKLQDRAYVQGGELKRAIGVFSGLEPTDFGSRLIFRDDPDQRVERFRVRGNIDWRSFNFGASRIQQARELNTVREQLRIAGTAAKSQIGKVLAAQERFIVSEYRHLLKAEFVEDSDLIAKFVASGAVRTMPSVSIYAKMWSKLLIDYYNRPIKPSDQTDVDVISTYLPYVDVLATDTFMANLVRNLRLDTDHDTVVFGAGNRDLKDFEQWLSHEMTVLKPINRPALSVFVMSDDTIKSDSWEFFRKLGNLAKGSEGLRGCWVEVFAFDDGNMPQYQRPEIENWFPFYGLQDVSTIALPRSASTEDMISLCQKHSRAPGFVFIDHDQILPDNFIQKALSCFEEEGDTVLGYKIIRE